MTDNILHAALVTLFVTLMGMAVVSYRDATTSSKQAAAHRADVTISSARNVGTTQRPAAHVRATTADVQTGRGG